MWFKAFELHCVCKTSNLNTSLLIKVLLKS